MSKTKTYFRIGVFVITAVAAGSTGLILFSQGLFDKTGIPVETYLDEAVPGLSVGSPVNFRGVDIGKVTSISFAYQTKSALNEGESFRETGRWVVIRMEIKPNFFIDQKGTERKPEVMVNEEIDRGLFVRLASDGLQTVTHMEFDYDDKKHDAKKEEPADLGKDPKVGVSPTVAPGSRRPAHKDPKYIWVPSQPSTVNRLTKQAEQVVNSLAGAHIEVVAKDLQDAVKKFTEQLSKLDVSEINKVVTSANGTILSANREITDLGKQLKALLAPVQTLIDKDLKEIFIGLNKIIVNLDSTAKNLPETLASLQSTITRVDRVIAVEQAELNDVLGNVRAISHNVQELSGYGKKFPAHILFGNPPPARERQK